MLFPLNGSTREPTTRARCVAILALFTVVASQTVTSDNDWKAQGVSLRGTPEAEFIIRVGDVDNLGFGWPEKFDPFAAV